MSETVKKERRWPWVLLLVGILLFLGLFIPWPHRSLNRAETRLIGLWGMESSGGRERLLYHFENDRTFTAFYEHRIPLSSGVTRITRGTFGEGTWSCSDKLLTLRKTNPWESDWSTAAEYLISLWFNRAQVEEIPLRIDGYQKVQIGDVHFIKGDGSPSFSSADRQ